MRQTRSKPALSTCIVCAEPVGVLGSPRRPRIVDFDGSAHRCPLTTTQEREAATAIAAIFDQVPACE